MITCSVCKQQTVKNPEAATTETGVCFNCRTVLAIEPMGEPVRPPVPCLRCNAMRFTRIQPRLYNGPLRAWPVTHEPYVIEGVFGDTVTADGKQYFGSFEMYVCQGCGFVEWYCREPKGFPIGPHYMTDEVDYSPTSEYR
jgi:hypothetical protein